jgi:hypothetical protein
MPWVRIDEHAMSHPKIAGLSDGAFRLWVQALAHCQNFLTDGLVKAVALRGMSAYNPKRRSELVTAGLWIEATDAGIQVHDYLQWNDSREHVSAIREREKDRKRKWREGKDAGRDAGQTADETRCPPLRACVVSSPALKVTEGGVGETKTLTQRAGEFCDWYGDKHLELFNVGYIGNPQKDYGIAQRLCQQAGDAELRDAALVWFGMDDDFATKGTRTLAKFASRATHCIQIARKVSA